MAAHPPGDSAQHQAARDRVRDPIPYAAVTMDCGDSLHHFDKGAEQREAERQLKRRGRWIRQLREQTQGHERGDVLYLVGRLAWDLRRMWQHRHHQRKDRRRPESQAQCPSAELYLGCRYPRSPNEGGGGLLSGAAAWVRRLPRFFTMMMLRAGTGAGRKVVLRMQFSKPAQSTR